MSQMVVCVIAPKTSVTRQSSATRTETGSGLYFVMVTVLDLVPAWPCPGWPGAVPGRRVLAQAVWSGGLRGTDSTGALLSSGAGLAGQRGLVAAPPRGGGSNVVPALR